MKLEENGIRRRWRDLHPHFGKPCFTIKLQSHWRVDGWICTNEAEAFRVACGMGLSASLRHSLATPLFELAYNGVRMF